MDNNNNISKWTYTELVVRQTFRGIYRGQIDLKLTDVNTVSKVAISNDMARPDIVYLQQHQSKYADVLKELKEITPKTEHIQNAHSVVDTLIANTPENQKTIATNELIDVKKRYLSAVIPHESLKDSTHPTTLACNDIADHVLSDLNKLSHDKFETREHAHDISVIYCKATKNMQNDVPLICDSTKKELKDNETVQNVIGCLGKLLKPENTPYINMLKNLAMETNPFLVSYLLSYHIALDSGMENYLALQSILRNRKNIVLFLDLLTESVLNRDLDTEATANAQKARRAVFTGASLLAIQFIFCYFNSPIPIKQIAEVSQEPIKEALKGPWTETAQGKDHLNELYNKGYDIAKSIWVFLNGARDGINKK